MSLKSVVQLIEKANHSELRVLALDFLRSRDRLILLFKFFGAADVDR